jgi:putative oxidoreductase
LTDWPLASTAGMQRLFSTFPGAWPGVALLLLRCVAAVALIACTNGMWLSLEPALLLTHGLTIMTAMMLIGGLGTPVAGVAQALLELYSNFSTAAADLNHMLWAAVGLCVAMLGPGACSIDSRLFGRKRIEVRRSPWD